MGKVIFEHKLEGEQRSSPGDIWEENIPFQYLSEFQSPAWLTSPKSTLITWHPWALLQWQRTWFMAAAS